VPARNLPRLFRIILQVNGLDRTERFYTRLLGTPGRRVGGGRLYYQVGPVILALLDPSADDGPKGVPSPDHVYFAVRDLGPFHRRAQKLRGLSRGQVHGEPAGEIRVRPWGERSFYVRDPSGNRLCFVDRSTVFTGR
jgi:catechol 2,3-dioxygenase-like lactoylglutathione lyase family enzyme